MYLLKKIDEIYADTSVKKRFLSKSMFWICVSIIPAFIYGLTINLIEGDYFTGVFEGLFAAFLISGIFLIFAKKIDLLSSLFVYAALAVGIVAGILGRGPSLYGAYIAFVFLTPSLICLSLLGQSVLHAIITSTVALGSIVVAYLTKSLPAAEAAVAVAAEGVDTSLATLLMAPLMMATVIALFSVMAVYSTRNIINQLSDSEVESKERIDNLTRFFGSLKETINIGVDLNSSAEHSLELSGTISENLKSMEKSVEKLIVQIKSTQNIHETINQAGLAVTEGAQTQSTAVEQSSSAVEEMAASIIEMSKTAESKRELIEQLVATEREVAGQIKTGQRSFDEVKKSTGEMLSVVAVISDIAERTNLLAMNAAIEAAHAGSTGKGFAVVAQEIRKLAVEAGSNSQKIKDIIEGSIKGIDHAFTINSKVGNEFHVVSTQVRDLDGALSEIITGFSELAAGTNEITRVVENLATINNSVQSSVREVTDQLSKGRESVDQISVATEGIIGDMKDIGGNSQSISNEAESIYKIGQDNVKHIRLLEEKLN